MYPDLLKFVDLNFTNRDIFKVGRQIISNPVTMLAMGKAQDSDLSLTSRNRLSYSVLYLSKRPGPVIEAPYRFPRRFPSTTTSWYHDL